MYKFIPNYIPETYVYEVIVSGILYIQKNWIFTFNGLSIKKKTLSSHQYYKRLRNAVEGDKVRELTSTYIANSVYYVCILYVLCEYMKLSEIINPKCCCVVKI